MGSRKSKHTLLILFTGVLCAVLIVRLFILTVFQNEKWQKYVEDISQRSVYETAPRGDILDRNGNILATSRPVYSVKINRLGLTSENALSISSEIIDILAEQGEDIRITQNEIRSLMDNPDYYSYMPVELADDVSESTVRKIEECNYKGVQIFTDYVRTYPNGTLASHVIGYLGRITEDEEEELVGQRGYRKDALVGRDGIEKAFENSLKGQDTVSTLQIDSDGRVCRNLGKTIGSKGKDITLTLDAELQKTAEDALEQAINKASSGGVFESAYGDYSMTYAENAAAGAAVAIDVKSGQVLAMASFPDFDPNDFVDGMTEEKWETLQRKNEYDPLSTSPLYNIAAMTAVQPGSVFKPVTALAALDCGLDRNKYLYDDGYIDIGGSEYGCHLWNDSEMKHGFVNLKDAIKVSCNYYFYDIASGYDFASGEDLGYNKKIDINKIVSFAYSLGLGQKTGVEISESQGTVPSDSLKKQGVKNSLRNFLLAESETYFEKSSLKDRENARKNIEKIVNWSDKDLTLDEIIGKLCNESFVKRDKAEELAAVCKYNYFDQTEWNIGDLFNISIGQGDNAYTVLQVAAYMAALVNDGIKNRITLVADSAEDTGRDTGISSQDIRDVIDGMRCTAQEKEGSLYSAFGRFPYDVAAKSGTAQKAGFIDTEEEKDYLRRYLHLIAPDVSFEEVQNEAGRLMGEYPDYYDSEDIALRRAVINLSSDRITSEDLDAYKKKYDSFAWTAALAPADDPQIAVAVMLVQGKTSANAAPVVREIIGKYGEKSGWEKLF